MNFIEQPDPIRMRQRGIENCSHEPVVDGMCYCVEHTRLSCWCDEVFLNEIVDGKLVHSAEARWAAHQLRFRCGPWIGLLRGEMSSWYSSSK